MKPLVSPAVELQAHGTLTLTVAAVFLVITADASTGSLVGLLLGAGLFGGFMYSVTRTRAEKSLATVQDYGGQSLESTWVTRRRMTVRSCVAFALLVVVAVVFDDTAIVGGIAAGAGGCSIAASLWISRWEQDHLARIFRERPRSWAVWKSGSGLGQWYRVPNPDA